MEIKLDKDAVAEVVKSAILDRLGTEGQEKLIQAALEYLLTAPPRDQYEWSQTPSPLQIAFNEAVAQAARKIVADEIATQPEFVERVKLKVGEAMALMDEANYSSYVAEALAEALRKR